MKHRTSDRLVWIQTGFGLKHSTTSTKPVGFGERNKMEGEQQNVDSSRIGVHQSRGERGSRQERHFLVGCARMCLVLHHAGCQRASDVCVSLTNSTEQLLKTVQKQLSFISVWKKILGKKAAGKGKKTSSSWNFPIFNRALQADPGRVPPNVPGKN